METISWLVSEVKNQVLSAAWAVFGSTFFYAFIGLLAGLVLVGIAGRLGLFRREFTFWNIIAKLHYVYLPLLFLALGATIGFVKGAYKTADRFIDRSTEPLVEYGEQYMALFQAQLAEISQNPAEDLTVEGVIAEMLEQEMQVRPGTYAYSALVHINRTVVDHLFNSLKISRSFRNNPLALSRALEAQPQEASLFSAIPLALHQACDAFFWVKFQLVWFFFRPLLLIPAAELFLYLLYRWVFGRR